MTNPNQDTDPSTPGAKRQSEPRTPGAHPVEERAGSKPPRSRPNTDPGIAPPGPMLPVPDQPMGIVVPPAGSVTLNDSVDVLLEGIRREATDRARATSNSDGHAAARYHVEHAVRASDRSPPHDEPKVVIDRTPSGQVSRVARYAGAVDDGDPRAWTETTAITTHSMASRVVIALGAGVIVVVAIFVALQRTTNDRVPLLRGAPAPASPSTPVFAAGPAPRAAPVAAAATVASPVAPPAPVDAHGAVPPTSTQAAASQAPPVDPPPGSPVLTAVSAESLPAASNDAAHRAATPPSTHPGHPRPKPVASGAKPASDLGEFKTSL